MYAIRSYYGKNFSDLIVKNSNSLLHLIEDILDFSQIEADQLKLNIRNFEVLNLIEEVFSVITSYSIHYTKLYEH